jgi:hypothetical protein
MSRTQSAGKVHIAMRRQVPSAFERMLLPRGPVPIRDSSDQGRAP